jgi:glycosyltransferase involved in cell wall biosynthesis
MRLIIHAPNVHEGGGRTLLVALLEALNPRDDAIAIVDARLALPPTVPEERIALKALPTLFGRLAAEWGLRSLAKPDTTVLCLGNLPPLLGAQGHIVLFIHNRFLVGNHPLGAFPLRVRLRMALERQWLRSRLPGVHAVVVQTPAMSREVERELGIRPIIAPFVHNSIHHSLRAAAKSEAEKAEFDFLYVASGEPHKNHDNLIAAWEQLAQDGFHPSLCLTIARDRYPNLHARIEQARSRHQLRLQNCDALSPEAVKSLYRRSAAMIYPSLLESFGLPLIEARSEGLPILAAELDYVRDLVDPEESFDPGSPVSIARAVKRFLRADNEALPTISAEQFIDRLSSGFFAHK